MRDWLKKLRIEKGMTQQEVAKQLDLSDAYYSYIESGERQKKMNIALASKLSVVFQIPIEQIIENESAR